MRNNKEDVKTILSFKKKILLVVGSLFRSGLNLAYRFEVLSQIGLFIIDSSVTWNPCWGGELCRVGSVELRPPR